MTSHLSRSEFVDLAEGTLTPARAGHIEACAACREQVETLRSVLRDTSAVDVPDPSPLFWEHFSSRVREEVAAAPRPRRSGWDWLGIRGLAPLGAVVAVVVAVGSGALLIHDARTGQIEPQRAQATMPAPAATDPDRDFLDPGLDSDNAAVWAILTAVAADVTVEDAHAVGMSVHPGTIDRAVQGMRPAELNELGRLLQNELKRSTN